jgi:hypothetical protein
LFFFYERKFDTQKMIPCGFTPWKNTISHTPVLLLHKVWTGDEVFEDLEVLGDGIGATTGRLRRGVHHATREHQRCDGCENDTVKQIENKHD